MFTTRIYLWIRLVYRWILRQRSDLFRALGRHSIRLGGPLGFYSVLRGPEKVSLVLEGQESFPAGPNSLRVRCQFEQHLRQPWPIFWQKISPARLVGESLAVLNDRKELMLESAYGEKHIKDDPSYNYLHLPPATHLAGPWTSLISRWYPATSHNYYHWLTDALPRLALLDRFPAETRILGPISLSAFQRDTLEILGLVDRYRATPEHHLTLDDYYYSSFTAMTGCDNPYALQFLRRSFLASASPTAPQPEKIYITRLGSSRSAQDEEQMISILESQGWTIIRTQDYSFREQIALFSNARAVCSIHGAGLTNLVWCQPGCRVLELCPSNFLNGCYEGMSACLGLDYRYLVFEADAHYQMRVDLGEFTAAIAAMGRN